MDLLNCAEYFFMCIGYPGTPTPHPGQVVVEQEPGYAHPYLPGTGPCHASHGENVSQPSISYHISQTFLLRYMQSIPIRIVNTYGRIKKIYSNIKSWKSLWYKTTPHCPPTTQKLKFKDFCLQTFKSIVNFDSLTGFQCSTKTIRSNNFFIMDCVFLKILRVFESLTVAITSIDISRGLKKLKHCSLFVFFSEGVWVCYIVQQKH